MNTLLTLLIATLTAPSATTCYEEDNLFFTTSEIANYKSNTGADEVQIYKDCDETGSFVCVNFIYNENTDTTGKTLYMETLADDMPGTYATELSSYDWLRVNMVFRTTQTYTTMSGEETGDVEYEGVQFMRQL